MIWGLSFAVGLNSMAIIVLAWRLNRHTKTRHHRHILGRMNGREAAKID